MLSIARAMFGGAGCVGSRFFFFFQAEDGIRDGRVTEVQTCALPISGAALSYRAGAALWGVRGGGRTEVTVPRGRKARPGIRLHFADLPADEATVHHGGIAALLEDRKSVV